MPCSKNARHKTRGSRPDNSANSQPVPIFFTVRFSGKFSAKFLLKSHRTSCVATLPCKILMSENERQSQANAVINELQGTIIPYLSCGGISNNHIKKGLSLPVKKVVKSVNIWRGYGLKGELCRVHFLPL